MLCGQRIGPMFTLLMKESLNYLIIGSIMFYVYVSKMEKSKAKVCKEKGSLKVWWCFPQLRCVLRSYMAE